MVVGWLLREKGQQTPFGLAASQTQAYLVEVFFAPIPVPEFSTELGPVVIRAMATADPSVIIQGTATAKDFAARVWLLDTSVFWSIYHGCLETPVILTVAEFKCPSWRGYHVDFTSVAISIVRIEQHS